MRRLVVVALVVGALAGCGEAPATPPAPAPNPTTVPAPAAVTAEVCATVTAYNAAAFAQLSAHHAELVAATAAKDEARAKQAGAAAARLIDEWQARLNELIARKPSEAVVRELADLGMVVANEVGGTAEAALAAYTKASDELVAACG